MFSSFALVPDAEPLYLAQCQSGLITYTILSNHLLFSRLPLRMLFLRLNANLILFLRKRYER